jgi:hypothetical protein
MKDGEMRLVAPPQALLGRNSDGQVCLKIADSN